MQIRQKQQTPHFWTQTCDSQGFAYILWMLYTSQAPILDLTGEHIKTKEDIEAVFCTLNLCSQEEEEHKSDGRKERRAS